MSNEEERVPSGWHASKGEQYKALCDYAKHLSTLAAGSIVLMSTLLEKLFAHPLARNWVLAGVAFFVLSIAAALLSFLVTAVTFPHAGRFTRSESEARMMAAGIVLSSTFFFLGLVSLAWFFAINWTSP
jgi:hypothetical protein